MVPVMTPQSHFTTDGGGTATSGTRAAVTHRSRRCCEFRFAWRWCCCLLRCYRRSSMNISFAAGAIQDSATTAFGAGTMSSSFMIGAGGSNTVFFASAVLRQPSSLLAVALPPSKVASSRLQHQYLDTASASTGTGIFGIVEKFQPSADNRLPNRSVDIRNPSGGGFFMCSFQYGSLRWMMAAMRSWLLARQPL